MHWELQSELESIHNRIFYGKPELELKRSKISRESEYINLNYRCTEILNGNSFYKENTSVDTEPYILIYKTPPITEFGIQLELYGTNPKFRKEVFKNDI